MCSARRLQEVYNEVKHFLNHDMSGDYYNEHLNYIGDGSITEVFIQLQSIYNLCFNFSINFTELRNTISIRANAGYQWTFSNAKCTAIHDAK